MATKKKSKKKTKKKVARGGKATAKKSAARKKVAKKAAAKKPAAKKAARKKAAKKKPAAAKKRAAKKTTAADLRKRAEQAEIEVKTEAAAPAAPGVEGMAAAMGGLPIPNVDLGALDLSGVQESVRGIVDFVEENPVAAAAVALGAGVVLTSLYWDKAAGKNKG